MGWQPILCDVDSNLFVGSFKIGILANFIALLPEQCYKRIDRFFIRHAWGPIIILVRPPSARLVSYDPRDAIRLVRFVACFSVVVFSKVRVVSQPRGA